MSIIKKELPRLSDGTIDYSKIDLAEDFGLFPKLFSTPDDIEKFIIDNNVDVPLTKDILKHLKGIKLSITPTEKKFYSEAMFDYIYDVFRIPVPETTKKVIDWLNDWVEDNLRESGFAYFKKHSYESLRDHYNTQLHLKSILEKYHYEQGADSILPEINFFNDIELDHSKDYYISKAENIVEQFWIRSDMNSGQPVWIKKENEAYMRVHVYPDRVYIFGCDDMSWTFKARIREDALEFSQYLKCAAPVWNFNYRKLIHPNLEFTN